MRITASLSTALLAVSLCYGCQEPDRFMSTDQALPAGGSEKDAAPPPAPSLFGSWAYGGSDGSATTLSLNIDGTYAVVFTAHGDASKVEVVDGTYSLETNNTIKLRPIASSCPGPQPISEATYNVTETTLTLEGSTSTRLFVAVPAPDIAGAVLGCYTSDLLYFMARVEASVSN